MKKAIRYIIAVFLIMAVVAYGFSLAACSGGAESSSALARPVVTQVERTIIVEWEEVEGATHYEIRVTRRFGCSSINEGVREWTETAFDLGTLNLSNRGHTYGVTVRAVSVTDYQTIRGPWSTSLPVVIY